MIRLNFFLIGLWLGFVICSVSTKIKWQTNFAIGIGIFIVILSMFEKKRKNKK